MEEIKELSGQAKVQEQRDKKRDVTRYMIYIPSRIVKRLAVKKGNIVDFKMCNPEPDFIEEPKAGMNFHKLANSAKVEEKETPNESPEQNKPKMFL